ncbi:hypothetical protein ASZ90_017367 [hydrocarbon metagenome]|uniref:Lipoprotein n=1 Tax=hydrocarbon metagenome TaxID=938273 RepID=A0A0W8E9K3_9ZZZZ
MKRAAVILITVLILTTAVGCQTSANRPLTQDQNQTDNTQTSVNNNQAMVDKFENLAEQVPGVQRAYVAISNPNVDNNNTGTGTINNNQGTNAPTNTNRDTTNDILNYQSYDNITTRNNPNNPTDVNDTRNNNMVVMVGIRLDDQRNTAAMSDIERQVESKIRNADTRVTRVLVTADAGMIQQINDINTSIRNGTPMTTIQRSIDNLTRNMTTNR